MFFKLPISFEKVERFLVFFVFVILTVIYKMARYAWSIPGCVSLEYPKNYPSQRRGSFLGYEGEGIQTSRLARGVNYTFWNVGQHIGSFWGVFLGAHGDFFSLRRQEYIFLTFEVAEARVGSLWWFFKILKLGSGILLVTCLFMMHNTTIIVSLHKS